MCAPYVEARPKGGARAEKEIGEKAQKIIMYQIVSTYFSTRCVQSIVFGLKTCLQPSFGLTMCTSVLSLNTLKTCLHYMLDRYKKEVGEPSGLRFVYCEKSCSHLFSVLVPSTTKSSPSIFVMKGQPRAL